MDYFQCESIPFCEEHSKNGTVCSFKIELLMLFTHCDMHRCQNKTVVYAANCGALTCYYNLLSKQEQSTEIVRRLNNVYRYRNVTDLHLS